MKTLSVPMSSRWMLLLMLSACLTLSACLARTARADCGGNCAFCARQLHLQLQDINSIECVLECVERVNAGGSWGLCQRVMQKAEGILQRADRTHAGSMKRYGGFMKKTAELYEPQPEDALRSNAILTNHDVEVLTNQVEADGEREAATPKEGVAKRYGGFMKRGGVYELRNRARLQKRYGGFMRRVGPPQRWDGSRRSREEDEEENSSEIEKRYGGFMGF